MGRDLGDRRSSTKPRCPGDSRQLRSSRTCFMRNRLCPSYVVPAAACEVAKKRNDCLRQMGIDCLKALGSHASCFRITLSFIAFRRLKIQSETHRRFLGAEARRNYSSGHEKPRHRQTPYHPPLLRAERLGRWTLSDPLRASRQNLSIRQLAQRTYRHFGACSAQSFNGIVK